VTSYSPYWIGQIAQRYTAEGPDGMRNRRHAQPPAHDLPSCVSSADSGAARGLARHPGSGRRTPSHAVARRRTPSHAVAHRERWRGSDAAAWISERIGRPVAYSLGYAYRQRLKHSQPLPRPQQAQADSAAQEAFKKR
jgi:Winged helix-turn helix